MNSLVKNTHYVLKSFISKFNTQLELLKVSIPNSNSFNGGLF